MRKITLLALGLLACKHAGSGEGVLESAADATGSQSEGKAEFTWNSGADASNGKIQAALPDGKTFAGTFLQVTTATHVDTVGPYYNAWSTPAWGLANPWYYGDTMGFVRAYSGRMVAHLKSPDGTRMRCRFILREPERGLTGGAAGDCQLSDRKSIFDAQLRGSRG